MFSNKKPVGSAGFPRDGKALWDGAKVTSDRATGRHQSGGLQHRPMRPEGRRHLLALGLILAACSAAHATQYGGSIRKGGKVNLRYVSGQSLIGGTYDMHALATVSGVGVDQDDRGGTYDDTGTDSTRACRIQGNDIIARARAVMRKSRFNEQSIEWDPNESYADIFPGDVRRGQARAKWLINDPLQMTRTSGPDVESLQLSFSMPDGFSIGTSPAWDQGEAQYFIEAASSVAGFEQLFALQIEMSSNNPLTVVMSSNPLLGLDDAAIAKALHDALNAGYDDDENTHSLLEDTPVFTLYIPGIRLGETVEMTINTGSEVSVDGTPEPASLLLLTSGIVLLRRR